jgi:hypothetical protein
MSKMRRAKAHEEPADEEELALQELVFGSSSGSRKRRGGSSAGDDEVTIELDRRGAKPKAKGSGGAVWHDEDDAKTRQRWTCTSSTGRLKKLSSPTYVRL